MIPDEAVSPLATKSVALNGPSEVLYAKSVALGGKVPALPVLATPYMETRLSLPTSRIKKCPDRLVLYGSVAVDSENSKRKKGKEDAVSKKIALGISRKGSLSARLPHSDASPCPNNGAQTERAVSARLPAVHQAICQEQRGVRNNVPLPEMHVHLVPPPTGHCMCVYLCVCAAETYADVS